MPRPPQSALDPDFWDKLRDQLLAYVQSKVGETQRSLAQKLALGPSTLNNFLNRHSDRLDGHAVALACTMMTVACNGTEIGKIGQSQNGHQTDDSPAQLVMEFDDAFEVNPDPEHPTLLLRKGPSHSDSVRILVKRIG